MPLWKKSRIDEGEIFDKPINCVEEVWILVSNYEWLYEIYLIYLKGLNKTL